MPGIVAVDALEVPRTRDDFREVASLSRNYLTGRARFGRTLTRAEWVKELKRVSNLWLAERGRDYADFEWQGGYVDFSVSQSNLEHGAE